MPVVLTSGTLWMPPSDCPAGTSINVEAWGAGAGAGSGASFGSGAAGGAYVSTSMYVVTPNDVANGVPYALGVGSIGRSNAQPSNGGATSWSNNNLNLINNATYQGGAVGTPGTLPFSWGAFNLAGSGLSLDLVSLYNDLTGMPVIAFRLHGTAAGTPTIVFGPTGEPVTPGSYTDSLYMAQGGGSQTNVTAIGYVVDAFDGGGNYLSTPISPTVSLTTAFQRFSSPVTMPASTASSNNCAYVTCAAGAVDLTVLFKGFQMEAGGTLTAWKSTPGYTLAPGGAAGIGTAGGVGSTTGYVTDFFGYAEPGGNGQAYSAAGSGGGAPGNPGGMGGSASGGNGGVGGAGQLGGPVSTTTPGNSGLPDVSGGSGGGGLVRTSGVGGSGGFPGAGAGACTGSAGTGGNGAGGQIRLTYAATLPFRPATVAFQPILAQ